MADTERLINKAQGDSIISAIQGITARLQEMYTVDDAMSSSSENPVQNKVITAALNGKVDAVTGKGLSTNDYTNEEKALVATIPDKADADDVAGTQTASGNPLTLTDCAPINAESLVVELEPKQEGSGDPSPTNVRPIIGYTECEVDDVGKNLLNPTVARASTYLGSTGEALGNNDWSVYLCKVDGLSTITISGITHEDSGTYFVWLADPEIVSSTNRVGVLGYHKNYTNVDIPSGAKYLAMSFLSSPSSANYDFDTAQVENGSQATTYEPYQSTSATIQFGQTVYGGKSNFTDGGTSETYGYDADLGAAGRPWWAESEESGGVFRTVLPNSIYLGRLYCSMYKGVQKEWPDDGEISVTNSQEYQLLRIKDPTCAGYTAVEFAAHISGCQLAYELAEPTQLSTPPTDLKLLKGTNNLTTNGTTITLGYQPDNVIGEVKGEIEQHLEMPYLRILDNNVDTPINNYRIYYHFISGAYTLVNMDEMLQHRFIFVEVVYNPSGSGKQVMHSVLIDPRTIDGFEYRMKANENDTIWIESLLSESKFSLSLRTTGGSYSDGDPTDYYVSIRMVD